MIRYAGLFTDITLGILYIDFFFSYDIMQLGKNRDDYIICTSSENPGAATPGLSFWASCHYPCCLTTCKLGGKPRLPRQQ